MDSSFLFWWIVLIGMLPVAAPGQAEKLRLKHFQGIAQIRSGAGSCSTSSDCAYQLLNQRSSANQNGFFVYKDADSGFNHGLPILFGSIPLSNIKIDEGCVDAASSLTGCSSDPNAIDMDRGTVLSIGFPKLPLPEDFAGLNIQEPQNFDGRTIIGNGYDLTPADPTAISAIQFDVRAPSLGGMMAQFGVGGCISNFVPISQTWTTMTIPLDSLFPPPGDSTAICPPDITNTHILFSVAISGVKSPNGGTILLDNIQFTPVPKRQGTSPLASSLPLSTQTFGVFIPPGAATPPDQANRNVAAIYESALTILALLKRAQPSDLNNAVQIANALDYALHHDNHGGPIPPAPDGSGGLGLHSAYSAGDIALINDQAPPAAGKAGDIRLAGFFGGCPSTGFCEVLSGATGGNNAWAILAFAGVYLQTRDTIYLNDAETIGKWIIGSLTDRTDEIPFPAACLTAAPNLNASGYGGYFLGYADATLQFVCGKSTENNADIFAAFNLLAQIENARGNLAAAQQWTAVANVAGNFVIQMFDSANGRFFSGTVTAADAANPAAGSCPAISTRKGNDVINQCDFLDADSFVVLGMAGSQAFGLGLSPPPLDWNAPNQYILNLGGTIPDPPNNLNPPNNSGLPAGFTQAVTAGTTTFQGFDLIPAIPGTGVAWEFTGQMAEACSFVDILQNSSTFQNCTNTYVAQIQQAQNSAPFGDSLGLVASVLQNGDSLPPAAQFLSTPFQHIPERVGLAATNWAIFAELQFNPMAYGAASFLPASANFTNQLIGTTSMPQTTTLTNAGALPLSIASVAITGTSAAEFKETDNCAGASVPLGKTCVINTTFTPAAEGERTAMIVINLDGLGLRQVPLSGTGVPVNNFSISATPDSTTVVAGSSATFNITTATTAGSPQTVTLSTQSLPNGVTPTFNPPSITSGQSATLTVSMGVSVPPNVISFTIIGTGSSATSSAPATLDIQSPIGTSAAVITFPPQQVSTTSSMQELSVSNNGTSALNLTAQLAGEFYGDFQINGCISSIAAGSSCQLSVTFSPIGTGPRTASILLLDSGGDSPQNILLTGIGLGSCSNIKDCAYQELNQSMSANQRPFFVYEDADSAFNHGFPALFGSLDLISKVTIDAGCINNPSAKTGCSNDLTTFDGTRGTVFRITFPPVPANELVGLSFQDPQNFDGTHGNSYNLTGAKAVQFDARSPDNISVQFGVGGCVAPFMPLSSSWSTVTIPIQSLAAPPAANVTCPPDMSQTHILFSVGENDVLGISGGTVLLDNIQFPGLPPSQQFSLPVSTQTFGVIPKQTFPIPVDEAVRNLSTVEEAALTALTLLRRGNHVDTGNAVQILNSLDYALHHESSGDSLPIPADGSLGLHSAYEGGDVPLLNDQPPSFGGKAGNARLAGFFAGTGLCGQTGFCLVLDGAFSGSNAWAMLSFETAYLKLGNPLYLQDAETIGTWIIDTLEDTSEASFGGYFVGFSDGGLPKVLTLAKSTEFNADVYAAFNLLAEIEASTGNKKMAKTFADAARSAGDFVMDMFDPVGERFFAGTIPSAFADNIQPGTCPDKSLTRGTDVVNTCDSLTQNSFAILALAGSRDFGVGAPGKPIDWTLPLLHIQNTFAQSATESGVTFKGFNLVPNSGGIAWESTAQTVASCSFVDALVNRTDFEDCEEIYLPQILQAQNQASFGDATGVVAATLQHGDASDVTQQCIVTPFQCIPARVGLGATAWGALADQKLNPMAFAVSRLSTGIINFSSQIVMGSSSQTLSLANTGSSPLRLASPVTITGANAADYSETDNCSGAVIQPEDNCAITVTFAPNMFGLRTAILNIADNGLNAGEIVNLTGNATDFDVSANPTTQQVIAGTSAIYNLTIAPLGGLNQSVQLSCRNDFQIVGSVCNLSSSSVTLDGSNAVNVVVTVTTTGPSGTSSWIWVKLLPQFLQFPWLLTELGLILLGLFVIRRRSPKLKFAATCGVIMFCVSYWIGCGGGSGQNPPPPPPNVTQPGTYKVTINLNAGPRMKSEPLMLIVK